MEASPWLPFYIGLPLPNLLPPAGAIGATLPGTAMNNLYSSPKKVYTHYITSLLIVDQLDLEKKFEICKVHGPWGPFPWAPMVATYTI